MFDYNHFYDFFKDDSKTIRKTNIHSIQFNRLIGYNKDWKIYDIVYFEFMLLCYRRFGQGFTMKLSEFMRYTRLKKDSVASYTEKFETLGYITVERSSVKAKGTDYLNRYTVNFDAIIDSLDSIYEFNSAKPDEIDSEKKTLTEWLMYIRDNPYGEYFEQ